MTKRERILAALAGVDVNRVPLTIYPRMLPRGGAELALRNKGLALLQRVPAWRAEQREVVIHRQEYWENGQPMVRNAVRTPMGEVYSTTRLGAAYDTTWTIDHYVKRPEDYAVVEYMVRDRVQLPNVEAYRLAEERIGDDGLVICDIGYSPLMEMLVQLLGTERFAIDIVERPGEFFSLYELLTERRREVYLIAAESPAPLVLYCGNVHPGVVGLPRFRQFVVPHYEECADALHSTGKLMGVHLDADLQLLKEAVGHTRIDLVEAFTPPPDCDLSLAEARSAWPDKAIWVNFPSSVHLESPETIRETTERLLLEAAGGRVLLGITEDVPEPAIWQSLDAILDVINSVSVRG